MAGFEHFVQFFDKKFVTFFRRFLPFFAPLHEKRRKKEGEEAKRSSPSGFLFG